jgi:hypothetical protein
LQVFFSAFEKAGETFSSGAAVYRVPKQPDRCVRLAVTHRYPRSIRFA